MPKQIDANRLDGFLPFYRGIETRAVADADIVFDKPVTLRAATAGDLIYVDMQGNQHTLNGLSAGDDVVGPGDNLVGVIEIKGASTVTSVVIGIV